MALVKTPININFINGMNTKADPKQLSIGNFLYLKNSIFDVEGQLTKRNGFPKITQLPDAEQTTLTTFNDNLVATGESLYSFSADTNQWFNQGIVQPVTLESEALIRSATSQTSPDTAIAASGLACTVFVDSNKAYYQIADSNTGTQVVQRTLLASTAVHPRVFLLDKYFIVTFTATVSAAPHLRYIAIPTANPSSPLAAQDLSSVINNLTAPYDCVVANNTLFFSWQYSATAIRTAFLTSTLVSSSAVEQTQGSTIISIVADNSGSTPVIWTIVYDNSANSIKATAHNQILGQILPFTTVITSAGAEQITGVATGGTLTVIYEANNTYSFAPNAKTDYLSKNTLTEAGTVGTASVVVRSLGLASKAFIAASGTAYVLATYGGAYQPTYFLIDFSGNIVMRLAYTNGGGYESSFVLPSMSYIASSDQYAAPYLRKDFLVPLNKGLENPGSEPITSLYTQTGIDLAKFSINTGNQYSSEIANALHLTGGQLWMYDGAKPVEHGFQVWPEDVAGTTSTAGGGIGTGTYNYVFTYEWTDNQGNLHRSAPSIPIVITTTGSTSTNTLYVPTLRLTYKLDPNPVRIVGYRWSTNQQTYYQFTSVTNPVLNDPTVDSVTITDTLNDSAILGQTILYTTGGVIENTAAPASIASALFKNRLFLIDAENQNVLRYSKQVIQNTPVEMAEDFTLYIAPTTGSQGSTGPSKALSAMDDKLIVFKKDAIYYLVGTGPDNTGANNDFTDPVFITASVGTDNQNSIVLTPNGLMFQSDKGIWLLGRDLSTKYIGAPVQAFNSQRVLSAKIIPGTNQARFIMDSGITLVYDYYYNQWSVFSNLSAISSTLYEGAHTYLNVYGEVFQEKPGTYLDGSKPVLMSFTTGWINVAGIQGYERFYFLYLLGTYYTPFKLNVSLAYDYNSSPAQQIVVTPDNYVKPWGGEQLWGSEGPWGGPGNVFEPRVFPERQKCESFQIIVDEIYDSSFGVTAGAGLTLSGLNMIIGTKKGYRVNKASTSFG